MSTKQLIVVGMGYVGQANALAFVKKNWEVWVKDIKEVKNIYSDLDLDKVKWIKDEKAFNCDVMVCVNVPNDKNYSQLPAINALKDTLKEVRSLSSGKLILRSTILPCWLSHLDFDFYVPEFLHERIAVEEASHPKMLVVGRRHPSASESLEEISSWLDDKERFFSGTPEEAAVIKYLSNCWNSLCVGFVNEFGDSIGGLKLRTEEVIDFFFQKKSYLRYGGAAQGSCLPKDSAAFAYRYDSRIMKAFLEVNEEHAKRNDLKELHFEDSKQ